MISKKVAISDGLELAYMYICVYIYNVYYNMCVYICILCVCVCVLSLSPGNLLLIRTVVPSLVKALMHSHQTVNRHHVAGVS